MILDFKEYTSPISQTEAVLVHKTLMDCYFHYGKIRFKHEMASIKYLGIFLLTYLIFFGLQSKGIISNPLIGIVCTGIGFLLILGLNMWASFRNARELFKCAKEGMQLEETHSSDISFRFFHNCAATQRQEYRCSLFGSLLSFCVILGLTTISGILLSVKIDQIIRIFIFGSLTLITLALILMLFKTRSLRI